MSLVDAQVNIHMSDQEQEPDVTGGEEEEEDQLEEEVDGKLTLEYACVVVYDSLARDDILTNDIFHFVPHR